MKSPRLLPIVIFATVALLVFKGIGIVTEGGYVFAGTSSARADDTGGAAADSAAAPQAEPTLTDTSPTLTDTSPTLAFPAAVMKSPASNTAAGNAPAAPAPQAGGAAAPAQAAAAAAAPAAPAAGTAPAANAAQPNQNGQVTMVGPDAVPPGATDQVLQRLSQRRAELDKREADINTREAIVKAAEQQLTERGDALKALQGQISSVAQKPAANAQEMANVVKLYENMKPQDAATIFDGLEMSVLLHVAKGMDPRKMSPILAKMNAQKAQELTTQLAAGDMQPPPSVSSVAAADPNALPQIVGH